MSPGVLGYVTLSLAIASEIIATSFLKQSEQFTKLLPTLITFAGYAFSFYMLSFTLKTVPIGIAYAIWSGVGIVCISIIGVTFFKQHLDTPAVLGLSLIVIGVIIINLFSKSSVH